MSVKQNEMVVLVDEQDNELGLEEKMQAHVKGLLHRAFSVFIYRMKNDQIELLLQQRNFDKYHCGGLWTNACCSHPRQAESIIDGAKRRLQEEMGFVTELECIGTFIYRAEFCNGLIEHEYDHVLIGNFDSPIISFNVTEVNDYRWLSLSALKTDLVQNPVKYTPWLAPALSLVEKRWSTIAC